jgi:cell division protein FtsB
LFRRRWLLAAGALALLFARTLSCVIYGPDGWADYQKKRAELRQLNVALQQLQQENVELERHVRGLRSDRQVIEDEARKQGYVRPGERVYIPMPLRNSPPLAGGPQKPTQPGHGEQTAVNGGRLTSVRATVVLVLFAIAASPVFYGLWKRPITKRKC